MVDYSGVGRFIFLPRNLSPKTGIEVIFFFSRTPSIFLLVKSHTRVWRKEGGETSAGGRARSAQAYTQMASGLVESDTHITHIEQLD